MKLTPDIRRKRIEWVLRQRLQDYIGMEYSEENIQKMEYEVANTIHRLEGDDPDTNRWSLHTYKS